ncbi:MAG TPA: M15 family metallopeptidase [Candidatus Acidoferrum sp.]
MNKGPRRNFVSTLVALLYFSLLSAASNPQQTATAPGSPILPGPEPPDVPLAWKQLVGVYSDGKTSTILLEQDGKLLWKLPAKTPWNRTGKLEWDVQMEADGNLDARPQSAGVSMLLFPMRDEAGNVTQVNSGRLALKRSDAGADPAHFFHVTPSKRVSELRAEALRVNPPKEAGPFRKPELVELTSVDPGFHLDIRYAQSNNFLSTPVYTQARAFMQRPAAEALQRALKKLQPLGYGLLIHDAYRPWYVTKIFWDATPAADHTFVADPQKGSKHNRGCAVDLTLYDLATGQAIEMPGLYDEMSPRSFPTFPGGTSLQRWHRDLLRKAIESEGFTVDGNEWWHFDYKDWKQYPILNVPFEDLGKLAKPAGVQP